MKKRKVTAIALAALIGTGTLLNGAVATVFAQNDDGVSNAQGETSLHAQKTENSQSTGGTKLLGSVMPAPSEGEEEGGYPGRKSPRRM